MSRTPIAARTLPNYTQTEELCNMLTHMLGIIFGVTVLILCVAKAAVHHDLDGLVTSAIYGFSMILLYTVSTVYHGWPKNDNKKILQVIDHCTIYLLIVGTFVPICLTKLREQDPLATWVIFLGICLICAIGIVFTAIDFKKYQVLSMLGYLSPWLLLFARQELSMIFPPQFMQLIIGGGAAYTVGAILYGTKKPFMHAVFHVFILLGSVLHFLAIWMYCL